MAWGGPGLLGMAAGGLGGPMPALGASDAAPGLVNGPGRGPFCTDLDKPDRLLGDRSSRLVGWKGMSADLRGDPLSKVERSEVRYARDEHGDPARTAGNGGCGQGEGCGLLRAFRRL
jgi:hypothetical protein